MPTHWRFIASTLAAMAFLAAATHCHHAVPAEAEQVVVDIDVPVVAPKPPSLPEPPINVVTTDHPNDAGGVIDVSWEPSPNDDATARNVTGYVVERSSDGGQTWFKLGNMTPRTDLSQTIKKFSDEKKPRETREYIYRVTAVGPRGASQPTTAANAVTTRIQLFDWKKLWFGVILTVLCIGVIAFIFAARSGMPLHVRKIAGLEVVDEAVGRATEMGRSCIFVPGINDMNDIQTVAAITVLSRVAKTAAEYDARVEVPTARSLVMTAARDSVQTSFLTAGRPDAYSDDNIYYVTDEQFGYVAFLAGKMVREKPAACFYMGAFYAESLVLAETGNSIGAIQIAGTAEPSQLPFFVAACDYTLIGEEFFAASAYLSGEPDQLGSLKGQDIGKLVAVALILIGCVLATFASARSGSDTWKKRLDFLKDDVLNAGGGE